MLTFLLGATTYRCALFYWMECGSKDNALMFSHAFYVYFRRTIHVVKKNWLCMKIKPRKIPWFLFNICLCCQYF